jgi:pyruvate formate lyase activating enzyme
MGKIFAIKKYAIHDGPNIRTTIFFKGCPLRCAWCHNPEGIDPEISTIWLKDKCVHCSECIEKCPELALSSGGKGLIRDEGVCAGCSVCVDVCPALAHENVGREMSVDEVMAEIEKDIPFFDQSEGGVTFSGGEPLMQQRFLMKLLKSCGKRSIHRVVDTSMHAATELILEAAGEIELFLIDLKHMDSAVHKKYTGVGNSLILTNIKKLAETGAQINFRIPLIKGVNADSRNLHQSAVFISSLPGEYTVDLLPYHSIAAAKYTKLGMINHGDQFSKIDKDIMSQSINIFKNMGLNVQVGG